MENISLQAVIDAARVRLRDRHPGGVTLNVLSHGVRQEQDWWYVPVQPDRQPPKRYEYYESLAEAENELLRDDHMTVLFIPTPVDDAN